MVKKEKREYGVLITKKELNKLLKHVKKREVTTIKGKREKQKDIRFLKRKIKKEFG